MGDLHGRFGAAARVAVLFASIGSIHTVDAADHSSSKPAASGAPCDLGFYYLERGETKKALQYLDTAVKLPARRASAYSYRALALIKNREFKAALDDAEAAVAIAEANVKWKPPSGALHSELALAYLAKDEALRSLWSNETGLTPVIGKSNELELAIAACGDGIRLDSGNVTLYFHRADAFSREGEWAKCTADYSKIISIDPENAVAYAARGRARMMEKMWDEAIADLDKAIAINPKIAVAHLCRGFARIKDDELGNAFTDFEEALQLDPACISGWDVVTVLVCSDKWDSLGGALASLDRMCANAPEDAGFLLMRAQSHFLNGDVEKAGADCSAAERRNVPPFYRPWIDTIRQGIARTPGKVNGKESVGGRKRKEKPL